jgi:outer membrane protein OmpA-like peptidoglycan-associated protein
MSEGEKNERILPLVLTALILLVAAALGYLGYRVLNRLEEVDRHVADLSDNAAEAERLSSEALEQARQAEADARAAAEGRALAEAEKDRAKEEANQARDEAATARGDAAAAQQEADLAREEAERIRKEAEAEMARLQKALGKIAETRRTALGLVMNLGEDSLKFDFDKSDLKPENKELLSRIAGILLTSSDYTVSVNGHTDDVGTEEYNQKLSLRRAQSVRDYLVEAGVSPDIITVNGKGKSEPLVKGTSPEARAKNRRVEIGIVNARVHYRGAANPKK